MVAFLDAIATNHTSFFREEQHFAFLRDQVVPAAAGAAGPPGRSRCGARPVRRGEEPYTLAITLADALPDGADGVHDAGVGPVDEGAGHGPRRRLQDGSRARTFPLDVLRRHFERGMGAAGRAGARRRRACAGASSSPS